MPTCIRFNSHGRPNHDTLAINNWRREDDFDAVLLRHVTKDGKTTGEMIPVAGTRGSPARHASVASDGKGATLVAYESHPKTANLPIRIGFQVFRGVTDHATDNRNDGRED
jgi:hypothetical protein